MTNEKLNKRMCFLLGIKEKHFTSKAGVIDLLEIMEKREDWKSFRRFLIVRFFEDFYKPLTSPEGRIKLVEAAIEFMEEGK